MFYKHFSLILLLFQLFFLVCRRHQIASTKNTIKLLSENTEFFSFLSLLFCQIKFQASQQITVFSFYYILENVQNIMFLLLQCLYSVRETGTHIDTLIAEWAAFLFFFFLLGN